MIDELKAFEAGFDCVKNGANITNCDFRLFASPALTAAWERGKRFTEEKFSPPIKTDTENAE